MRNIAVSSPSPVALLYHYNASTMYNPSGYIYRPGGSRYLYPSAYVSVYAEARGVCGHAPLGEINAVRWLLRLFWSPKRHYYSLL